MPRKGDGWITDPIDLTEANEKFMMEVGDPYIQNKIGEWMALQKLEKFGFDYETLCHIAMFLLKNLREYMPPNFDLTEPNQRHYMKSKFDKFVMDLGYPYMCGKIVKTEFLEKIAGLGFDYKTLCHIIVLLLKNLRYVF